MVNKIIRKVKSGFIFYHKHGFVSTLHQIFINDYAIYRNLPPEKYEAALKQWYKRAAGMTLDLQHPRSYSEKIQWLKLYDSTPLKTRLTDKYLVREWVKEKIGEEYLIPLLGVWNDFDEIDFERLPDQFVLKATHGSGWNIIVRDKSKLDKRAAGKKFKKWLDTNYAFVSGFELHYMNIQPKIIAEAYVQTKDEDLYDYKIFCFGGKAEGILFMSGRAAELTKIFCDLHRNRQEDTFTRFLNDAAPLSPEQLDLMIRLSEKLSEGFPHVRVDFYILNDGSVKFGEMTFSPASGLRDWDSAEQERIFGDLLQLPAQKSPGPV